jgi:uncharacterized protein (TIGR02145 family)
MKIKTAWRVLAFSAVLAVGVLAVGCGGDDNHADNNNNNGGGGSDYVTLGGLKWMTSNLNVETADSWCYGEGDQVLDHDGGDYVTLTPTQIQANCAKYGRLYTWESAKSACQSIGKRLPTREEWTALAEAAGGACHDGTRGTGGKKLKSTSGWNNNGNGTNDYGFSALPGGHRDGSSFGVFYGAGYYGDWWTATENGESHAYNRGMRYDADCVSEREINFKREGSSVRCVE